MNLLNIMKILQVKLKLINLIGYHLSYKKLELKEKKWMILKIYLIVFVKLIYKALFLKTKKLYKIC